MEISIKPCCENMILLLTNGASIMPSSSRDCLVQYAAFVDVKNKKIILKNIEDGNDVISMDECPNCGKKIEVKIILDSRLRGNDK
ncbi:MAG: hypothetical protein ABFD76_11805 [Smithella sp.]